MVVATGVAIVAATPGIDVVAWFSGIVASPPLPPVAVIADPSARKFPTTLQNPSKPVRSVRLAGAAEDAYSAHVETAPSNTSGTQDVLL